jgi:phage baseplate assembly protein W
MAYYAPKLPLRRDPSTGYEMLDKLTEVVKQNFKMLMLTMPGERIMNPEFGVGLYQYLFEQIPSEQLQDKIRGRIVDQTRTYLPYISIKNMTFETSDSSPLTTGHNTLFVRIEYYVKNLNASDVLEVSVSENVF